MLRTASPQRDYHAHAHLNLVCRRPITYKEQPIERPTTEAIIRKARSLIPTDRHWERYTLAADICGNTVKYHSPEAASFCMRGATMRALKEMTGPGETPDHALLTPVNCALAAAVRVIRPDLVCHGIANTADNFNAHEHVYYSQILMALHMAAEISAGSGRYPAPTVIAESKLPAERLSNFGHWEMTGNPNCREWTQKLDFADGVTYLLYISERADGAYSPTALRISGTRRPQMFTGEDMPHFGDAAHWVECQGVTAVDQLAGKSAV